MNESITLGYALCGSFCTFQQSLQALRQLRQIYPQIIPLFSEASAAYDTRFGKAAAFIAEAESICGRKAILTIPEAEPIGPKKLLDLLVVAPCTGNTLAKLANGIADSTVTLACKAHLRNQRPVVVAVSSNDALAANAASIGRLLARQHFYFVPFCQDSPTDKPTSLVADFSRIVPTVQAALQQKQLQPLLLPPPTAVPCATQTPL